MAEPISTFQKFFRVQLLALDDVLAYSSASNIFNRIVADGTKVPYTVFMIVPLNDSVGQAKQSSQKNFLVDLKFVTGLPVPAELYPAKQAVEDHFRTSDAFTYENFRISIRHERPIEFDEIAVGGERWLHIGSTYRVRMTGMPL